MTDKTVEIYNLKKTTWKKSMNTLNFSICKKTDFDIIFRILKFKGELCVVY